MPIARRIENAMAAIDAYYTNKSDGFDWDTHFWNIKSDIMREADLGIKLSAANQFNEHICLRLMAFHPRIQYQGLIDVIQIRIDLAALAVDNFLRDYYNLETSSESFDWETHFHQLGRDISALDIDPMQSGFFAHCFNQRVADKLMNTHPQVQHMLLDESYPDRSEGGVSFSL